MDAHGSTRPTMQNQPRKAATAPNVPYSGEGRCPQTVRKRRVEGALRAVPDRHMEGRGPDELTARYGMPRHAHNAGYERLHPLHDALF